jgi:hypothetical protein
MPIEFDFSKLPPESLARAQEDLRKWSLRYPVLKGADLNRTNWKKWAGSDLAPMMASREATRTYLQHADPNLRRTAACLVTGFWLPGSEYFLQDILRLAFVDPDESVRGAALQSLWFLSPYLADHGELVRRLFPLTSSTRQSLEQVLSELKETREENKQRMIRVYNNARSKWRALAGPYGARLESSREFAEECIGNDDSALRRAAISVLYYEWKAIPFLADKCEDLVVNDPNVLVRCEAATTLGACFAGTGDSRVGRRIAGIVRDKSENAELRWRAYRALLMIRGMPISAYFSSGSQPETFDWEFVSTFF